MRTSLHSLFLSSQLRCPNKERQQEIKEQKRKGKHNPLMFQFHSHQSPRHKDITVDTHLQENETEALVVIYL